MKQLLFKIPLLRKFAVLIRVLRLLYRDSAFYADLPRRLAELETSSTTSIEGLKDAVIYFEYRVDRIHQNIAARLSASSENSGLSAPPRAFVPCLVCASESQSTMTIESYDYYLCSACKHTFVSPTHENEFAKEFYNSEAYRVKEDEWPQSERLNLFDMILQRIELDIGKNARVLDYGSGAKDIAEKRKRFENIVFYDPYFSSSGVINRIQDLGDSLFDAVIMTEVFEHVFHPNAIMSEIDKVLKRSAAAYVTTLLSDYKFNLGYITPSAGHVSVFSLQSMKALCLLHNMTYEIIHFDDAKTYYMLKISKINRAE